LRPGWLVLEGASVSYGKATPYFPLIEMLRRYFQIADGERSEGIQDRVVMHILELDPVLKDAIPPILSLLGALPDEVHPSAPLTQFKEVVDAAKRYLGMDPQQRRRYTLDAIKRVLIRESQRQSLLIVFEDLHWIDSETQAFLDSLIESLPMARIVLLVDYRPEFSHSWGDKSYYTQLRIDPLQPASAEELLQYLLGINEDLVRLKSLLIQRTEGNPFFAEESVRSLVETGVLVGEKGAYRPGLKIDEIQIPNTIQNVLADRIDRLPAEEKRLLQTAAVIGVNIPLPLLRAVAELPEDDLRRYVSHLQTAEFLYETNLFPEVEYAFKHALTTEVAYGALLHERRTSLHGLIVKALEAMTESIPHDHLERLAQHAFQAELWDKAVIYLREAGNKAVSLSSFRNAVLYFERALEALRHVPNTNGNLRNAVDVRIDIRNALFILGDFRQGSEYLEEAKEAAIALNDQGRLGTVFNLMTAHCNLAGKPEQAVAYAKQALEHTKASEYIDLHVVAHYFLGVADHNLGQYDQAVGILEQALYLIGDRKYELFGTTGIVSVICRAWLIRGLAQLGRFGEAVPHGDEAIRIATEANHPYSVVYAYYAVGVLSLIKGNYEKAIDVLERGLKVCDAAEIPVQRPLVASCLGAAYASVGRFDEALQLLESAVKDTASMRRMAGQAMRVAWLSGAYMLADRLDEAQAFARRGLELADESKDQGTRAWLFGILGDLTLRRRPINAEQAESSYRSALTLAQELGMRPLQAHCHFGLADGYAKMKDLTKARSEFQLAAELYRSMSMQSWLLKTEAALGNLH
jgi:tetratricopeptide (TPR) repeat protein